MSSETGQNLSEMEQTVASISSESSASSATSLVSSSSPSPLAAEQHQTSSSASPGKETQVVPHFPSTVPIPQSTSSSSSSSPSLQKLSPPPASLKSSQAQTTKHNRSVPSSSSSFSSYSISSSSSSFSYSSSSFASSTSAFSSSSVPNAMSISTTSCVSGGQVSEMLTEAKAGQEIDRNLNRCDPVMASSSNASLSSAAAVAMTVAAASATSAAGTIISAEPQNILGDPTQVHQLSQGMVAMPTNFNTSPTAITNVSPLTVQQNNIVVSHQQQFQQAVAAGLNHQTAAGCFNVQLGSSDQSSSQAHGALQQTTTMQGVLQQTVVVSDNVAVQQRVAVAQETVSQQIVHPVSSTNAVAQVTAVEQQQQAQQQAQQQQQQQTGGFQLHQATASNLPAQQTFQLTNLGQGLISPQNFSSLVAQPGTIFNGAQIFCSPDLTRTQQIDVSAMGCQQFLASPSNTFTGGHVVSGVPQVQLVQTGPNQFIQQQCLQQQFMFQSVPALQNNGVTIQQQHTAQQQHQQQQQQANLAGFQQQTQQTDATTKNQAILPATSQQQQSQQQQNIACLQQSQQQNTPQQNVSMIRFTVSGSYGIPQQQQQTLSVKGLATVLPQQNSMGMCNNNNNNNMNQKQLLQKQQTQQGQLLFGTIGMLPNQTLQQAPQQQTIYQQQRPLNLGTMNHQAAQITIGNNGALRFAGPSFITNTGQLLSSNPTVLNLGQIQVPIMNQQLLVAPQPGGTTTLLGSQPLYIRTADPFSNQQGVVGNVPMQQVKNIANIAPQTAAVINQVTPQPRRGGDKSGGVSGSQQISGKSGNKSVSNKLQSIAKSTSSTMSSAATSSNHSSSSAQTNVAHHHTAPSLSLPLTSSHTVVATPAKLAQSPMPTSDPSSVTVQDLSLTGRPPPVIVVQPKQQQIHSDEKRGVEKMIVDVADLGKHQQQSFPIDDKNLQMVSTATAFPHGGPVNNDNFNHDEANNLNFHLLSTTKEEDGDEQRLVIIEEPSNKLGSLPVKTAVTVASTKRQVKKMKKKRNAKPKVLTHIIEGFIIQEATEPFPVNRISLANQFLTSSLRSSSSESLAASTKESSPAGKNKHDSDKMEDSSTEEEENNDEDDDDDDDDDETEDESQPSSKRPRLDEPVKNNNTTAAASNVNMTPSSNNIIATNASSSVVVTMNTGQEAVCMSTAVPAQLTAINLSSTHQQQAAQLLPTANNQILSHVQPSPQLHLSQAQFHPQPKLATANKINQDRSSVTHLTCEFCGKTDLAENFPCSKRFCSVSCSKRFSAYSHRYKQVTDSGSDASTTADVKPLSMMSVVKGSKRPLGQPKSQPQFLNSERGPNTATVAASIHIPATASSTLPSSINNMLLTTANQQQQQQFDHTLLPQQQQQHLSYSTPTTAVTPSKQQQQPNNISPAKQHLSGTTTSNEDLAGVVCPDKPLSQWSVNDVFNFVGSLPGCATYAQEFRQQEIDGPALGLLKEDHLMTTLNVKLGPALKICAVVNSLKTD